jgi:hypothetical protein
MLEPIVSLFRGGAGQPWVIPVVGVAFAVLAFVLLRWMLVRSRPADEDEFTLASEHAFQGANSDRRAAPRRAGNVVEVSLWDGTDKPHVRGLVRDRSAGGLRLMLEEPVPEGIVLKVRPRFSPVTTPWTNVIIRSCRPDGGHWEVGCQFEQTPPYNILLLFG